MHTIKDVAKIAGVSTSTVSRALSGNIPVNDDTKKRVLDAVKQLNYKPNFLAKGLKEGRSNAIGLIIPDIRNPIFPALARGVEDTARSNGFNVIFSNSDENIENEINSVNMLKNRWVDGFIFATASLDCQHIHQLREENIPVVLMVRNIEESFDAVVTNNFEASYNAVKYLIDRGLKKIAIINGRLSLSLYRERYEGYKKALEDHGIDFSEEICFNCSMANGNCYEVVKNYFSTHRDVDGVFATNDSKAIEAIRAIKDVGLRVPTDISVIGFDDIQISALLDPQLTTVAQPLYDMGKLAVEKLIKIINEKSKRKKKPQIDVVKSELVIRNSTI
ncbi:LacI family DNA-binding transcriptional regulator [Clostridium formicaceticum]|uniref:Catabolite control protein A n=2 Tax=Clostridium formicaceticum TaxID=1497 RepID=A0AAC9RQ27_9CLOT|nr:LacI family DNA-binding transcriptional regulator [Clostridium formicaceticum]AOY74527.1 LacI family transcriptional regulator [Clostridium formicaceticum]ARE88883.1 Catabolite control protein A [Clostridium formicaceticum]